ncbi:MAG TPA: hypothetical protein VLE43_01450 [Candidatus Saccharimonadia bacterium]|nr:hypothetical protein [Candidatus Saccharimonadia bacterium]
MPRQEVQDVIDTANDIIAGKDKTYRGPTAFEVIQSNPNLSEPEKQEAFRAVVKQYVQKAYDTTTDKETLLRTDDLGTAFMSSYMKHYAADYNKAVMDSAKLGAMKAEVPPSLHSVETFGSIGTKLQDSSGGDISETDMKAYDDAVVDIAKQVLHTAETSVSQLPPDVRAFIQSAMQPAIDAGDTASGNKIAANTLFLRSAMAPIGNQAGTLRGTGDLKLQGALMANTSVLLQTYANFVLSAPGPVIQSGKTAPSKPQDSLVGGLRTQESLDQTKELFSALATGGQSVDDFMAKVGPSPTLSKDDHAKLGEIGRAITKNQKAEAALAEKTLGPDLDKITKLHASVDHLKNNPTFGDKFKAFFQGGLKKVIAKKEAEIDKTTEKIVQAIQAAPNRWDLDALIDRHQSRQKALEVVSDNLFKAGAEQYTLAKREGQDLSGMKPEKDMVKQFQKNETRVGKAETRIETLKSVRDELAQRAPKVEEPKVEAPKLDKNDKSLTESGKEVDTTSVLSQSQGGEVTAKTPEVGKLDDSTKVQVPPQVGDTTKVDTTSTTLGESQSPELQIPKTLPPLPNAPNKVTERVKLFEKLAEDNKPTVGLKSGIPKQGTTPPKEGEKVSHGL